MPAFLVLEKISCRLVGYSTRNMDKSQKRCRFWAAVSEISPDLFAEAEFSA